MPFVAFAERAMLIGKQRAYGFIVLKPEANTEASLAQEPRQRTSFFTKKMPNLHTPTLHPTLRGPPGEAWGSGWLVEGACVEFLACLTEGLHTVVCRPQFPGITCKGSSQGRFKYYATRALTYYCNKDMLRLPRALILVMAEPPKP